MVEIVPISGTEVNWELFLKASYAFLGRSITRNLDEKNKKIGDIASFIEALAEFENEHISPDTILRKAGALLRHISCGFFVAISNETIFELATKSDLKIVRQERCAIISGNLEEWRTSIINGCLESSSFELRLFFDKCLLYFESIGLGQLWVNYQKDRLRDQTFKLLEKK